jgi:hypothetical protein
MKKLFSIFFLLFSLISSAQTIKQKQVEGLADSLASNKTGATELTINQLKNATVANVAALRASDLWEKNVIRMWTQGYTAAGDGGGTQYRWVDTSTKADDSSFVIKPTDNAGNGRWEYLPSDNTYNFLALGGVGDNSTLNNWIWTKFHNKMPRDKSNATLFVPDGTYLFSNGIEQSRPFDVRGETSSVFMFPKSKVGVKFLSDMYGFIPTWRKMRVQANDKDTTDGKTGGVKSYYHPDYQYHGIWIETIVNLEEVTVRNFSGHGIKVYGAVVDYQLDITNAGSGYTDGTHTAINLTGGSGTDMLADFTVSGGVVTAVTFQRFGSHYLPGDVVTATIPGGSGFQGTVVRIPTNASNCGFKDISLERNTGAGIVITGPDASQCVVYGRSVVSENSLCGVYDSSYLGNQFYGIIAHHNGYLSTAGWGHFRVGLNGNARSTVIACYGEGQPSTSYMGALTTLVGGLHENGVEGPGMAIRNNRFNYLKVDGKLIVGTTDDSGDQFQVVGSSYFRGNIQQAGTNPDLHLLGDVSSYNPTIRLTAGAVGANATSKISTDAGLTLRSFSAIAFDVSADNGTNFAEKFRIKSTGQIQANGYGTGTSLTGTANKYAAFDADGNFIAVDAPEGTGTNNANIGSGFRWLKPAGQEIKTLFAGSNKLTIDSTTNTDGITIDIAQANLTLSQSQITDLITDLAAKQATLVSGTNIKTINGSSVLGSGDLTVTGTGTTINNNAATKIITGSGTANTLEAQNLFRYDPTWGTTGRLMVGYSTSVDNSWTHQINGSFSVWNATTKNFSVDDNGNVIARQQLQVGGSGNAEILKVKSAAGPDLTIIQTDGTTYVRAYNDLDLGSGQSNSRIIAKANGVVAIPNLGTASRLIGVNTSSDLVATSVDPANIVQATGGGSITGTPNGTKYLRDDFTWQTVTAGAGQNLTTGIGLKLDAGTTYNGSAAKTISIKGWQDWDEATVQTTDATITTAVSITCPNDATGTLVVEMVATKTDNSKSIVGRKTIHWHSSGGVVTVDETVDDNADYLRGFTTADWAVDASGSALRVRVTGEASTTVDWTPTYKLKYNSYAL